MFLFPRRRQGGAVSALIAATTALWPFGDAHDASAIADTSGRGNNLKPNIRINQTTCPFLMGRTVSATISQQQLHGGLKGWGHYKRMLTPTEKAALAGGEYWPFNITTSLRDAKAYYLLDEPSGAASYADATGRGNTLTPVGTITQGSGPLGTDKAAYFGGGGVDYLRRASPGLDLQGGQNATTVCGWARIDAKPGGQQIFWLEMDLDNQTVGFNVYYDGVSNRICVDNEGGDHKDLTTGFVLVDNVYGDVPTGTWLFLLAEFDIANNATTLSVNNGPKTSYGDRLQPVPAACGAGTGSKFFLNTPFNFALRQSGWDGLPGDLPMNGGSNANMLPNADVSIGNNAKTVWGWVKASDTTTLQVVAGIYTGVGSSSDWAILIQSGTLKFVFGQEMATVSVPFTDTTSAHLVVAWFDKVGGTININLDNFAQSATAAAPATPHTVTTKLVFGSNLANQFTGVLRYWGIADGVPTPDDIAALMLT